MNTTKSWRARRRVPLPRAAFTLIETAVVVSITSLLFALAATTLISLLRLERQCVADAARDRTLGRLANHFRADVHAAQSAEVGESCMLHLPDGTTAHYSFAPPAVVREVRRGEAVSHRDSFLLHRDQQVSFFTRSSSNRQILTIHVDSQNPASGFGPPMDIVALVNLRSVPLKSAAIPRLPSSTASPPAADAQPRGEAHP